MNGSWWDDVDIAELDLAPRYGPPPADDGAAFAAWFANQPEVLKDRARRAFPRLVAEVEREMSRG